MRIIGHIDMDAFFASVEEREKPYLKGSPIVVGADPEDGFGRGVVSTCNYPARKYGIHSAMPIREAWRRSCEQKKKGKPAVIFIAPAFNKYGAISRRIFGRIEQALLRELPEDHGMPSVFEQMSIDEAYLDLSLLRSYEKAESFLKEMQYRVYDGEGLTMSVGIGGSKLVAKIASDFKKPKGFFSVAPGAEADFLAPLPIRVIPGVGPKYAETLLGAGIKTVGDVQRLPEKEVVQRLGKRGLELRALALGIDPRELTPPQAPKSIGEQETLPKDSIELGELLPRLYAMAGNVWKRLKKEGFKGCKTIALTVRFADFATKIRSKTFSDSLRERHVFERFAVKLLLPFLDSRENQQGSPIRMIGLRVERLEEC